MKLEAPPPLKTGSTDFPELAQALEALRDAEADQARITRVAQKLGPLLDAPPPAPALTQWVGQGALKSLGAKLLVSALVMGGAGVWLASAKHPPENAVPPPQRAAPVDTPPALVPPAPQLVVEGPVPALEAGQTEPLAPASEPRLGGRPRARTAAPGRVEGALRPRLPADGPVASAEAPEASPAAEPPPEEAQPEPAVPPEPALPGEVDLLLMARRQLPRDPAAALRLLDQHAERFPHGMLAPEREVLAIQALRKQGRSAAADERMARFKAQYPDSLHLHSGH